MDINRIKKHTELTQEVVLNALYENYESIYVVDVETSSYQCFHESDSYSTLSIESHGEDFFEAGEANLQAIYKEDREYVKEKMAREAMLSALQKGKFYSFVYRLMIDGKPLYHKFRATMDLVDGRPHFLIGVRNVDAAFRQDKALAEKLASMHDKEINHLEAILASAEGYLEANLTKDMILETSPYIVPEKLPQNARQPTKKERLTYSAFEKWRIENMVAENKEKFKTISDRQYLIRCFERGEKRASVSFSMRTASSQNQPCKKVFYLYQDAASGDILSFCVLYDLTEQQRKEKELRELENELQLSRLRNFTGQMQPHFLYNALGSIQEIVLENPQYASELIGDFTIHLRSCIRSMSHDAPIPFDQELDNIKAYINIEKMRFGKKLQVVYDVRIQDFLILPLTVQPIVENAIRHGIYERGEHGGTVVIQTLEKGDSIQIIVSDDGVGFDVDALRKEIASGKRDAAGLRNIMFRLDKVMHAAVDLQSTVGSGTTVTITIPKKEALS